MRLAIMQPYFFPYLGYFCLLKHSDHFIAFDTPQFIKQGWIDRNRILHPVASWQYIHVPLLYHPREAPISEVRIDDTHDWRRCLVSKLGVYKPLAPYYHEVLDFVRSCLEEPCASISELNVRCLQATASYIGIEKKITLLSQMGLSLPAMCHCDEWALRICQAVGGVTEYINAPGGAEFYDRHKYEAAGIKLRFEKCELPPYDQKRPSFEPGLSILDVMMFNSPARIRDMLECCVCL